MLIHTSHVLIIKFYVNEDPQDCISVTNANSDMRSSRMVNCRHCVPLRYT